jgi:hypothetical protein
VRAQHAETSELVAMSGRELADIGINRHDVPSLFDPLLAQEFHLRRGVCAVPRTADGQRASGLLNGRYARPANAPPLTANTSPVT